MVTSCRANVTLTVWRPSYGVHLGGVAFQSSNGLHRKSKIENHDVVAVLLDRRELVNIAFVPSHPQQGLLVRALVNDGAVFEIAQIKVPDRSVLTRGCEEVLVAKANVKDRRVVRYQLSLHATGLDVPNRAGRVDRARADHGRHMRIPIETGNRGTVVGIGL